jgi:hypothetical protein
MHRLRTPRPIRSIRRSAGKNAGSGWHTAADIERPQIVRRQTHPLPDSIVGQILRTKRRAHHAGPTVRAAGEQEMA